MIDFKTPVAAFGSALFLLCVLLAMPAPAFAARSVSSSGPMFEEPQPQMAAEPSTEEEFSEPPRAAPARPADVAKPRPPAAREEKPADVSTTEAVPAEEAKPAPALSGTTHGDYVLGAGDKLKITVFGEADLSGPFEVSSTGMVSMPLIGQVRASGNTISRLEASITEKLKDGYMKDPRVSVEVQGYRPFFIVGEVMKPGRYDYVNGMTVITAVALAGGYTYRADKDGITLKHAGASSKEAPVKEDGAVVPGDVIRVPERFF